MHVQLYLPGHHGGDTRDSPSVSGLLMRALGFAENMRAAARTAGSTNAGARITFADVFSCMSPKPT
ncbi:hypothetical protein [Micromonospora sp. NPDC000668]|uniref:hypothetical protein n=1 Tax=Micromonospora sp. NPDC000668 TaxID=3364219 RepID=UPI0036D0300C